MRELIKLSKEFWVKKTLHSGAILFVKICEDSSRFPEELRSKNLHFFLAFDWYSFFGAIVSGTSNNYPLKHCITITIGERFGDTGDSVNFFRKNPAPMRKRASNFTVWLHLNCFARFVHFMDLSFLQKQETTLS